MVLGESLFIRMLASIKWIQSMHSILKNCNKLKFYFISVALYISADTSAQIIKTDTTIWNNEFKEIYILTSKGSFIKHIKGTDTTTTKHNSLFYYYVLDSIRNTKEYLTRDKITTDIDMLYIDIIWNTQGSWSASSFQNQSVPRDWAVYDRRVLYVDF